MGESDHYLTFHITHIPPPLLYHWSIIVLTNFHDHTIQSVFLIFENIYNVQVNLFKYGGIVTWQMDGRIDG